MEITWWGQMSASHRQNYKLFSPFCLIRFLSGSCPDGEKCIFAHGDAELQEWEERSKVLNQKLLKARKDQLISADDNDFGKYSFLINAFN